MARTESSFGQTLLGKIGSSPITLGVNERRGGQHLSELYYSGRLRTPISLSGKLIGNTWVLTENDDDGKLTAEIRATLVGDSFKGLWASGEKQLAFEVSP